MTNKIKETHEFKKKHNVDVKYVMGVIIQKLFALMLLVYLQKLIQLVKDLGTVVIIMNDDYMKELKYGEEEILFISGKKVFKEYYDNHLGEKDTLFFDGKI